MDADVWRTGGDKGVVGEVGDGGVTMCYLVLSKSREQERQRIIR